MSLHAHFQVDIFYEEMFMEVRNLKKLFGNNILPLFLSLIVKCQQFPFVLTF